MPYKKESGPYVHSSGHPDTVKIVEASLPAQSDTAESEYSTERPSVNYHEIIIPNWLDGYQDLNEEATAAVEWLGDIVDGGSPPGQDGASGLKEPENPHKPTAEGFRAPLASGPDNVEEFDLLVLHRDQAHWQRIEWAIAQHDWRYRTLTHLAALRDALARPTKAVLIDTSFLPEIMRHPCWLQSHNRAQPALFFVSDRCDIDTRIQAIQTGARKLFIEPIDLNALIKTIEDQIQPKSTARFRVLIVTDKEARAIHTAELLRQGAIESLVLTEPQAVIDSIWRFLPNLIVMLEPRLSHVDNIVLTKLLRDREESMAIPIVILSEDENAEMKQQALQAGVDDVLPISMQQEQLLTTIKCRIERTKAISTTGVQKCQEHPAELPDRVAMLLRLELAFCEPEEGVWFRGVTVIALGSLQGDATDNKGSRWERIIASLAEGLRPLLQGKDYLARIGQSHLAILVRRGVQKEVESVSELAFKIVKYRLNLHPSQVKGLGVGLAMYTSDIQSAEEMLQRGELAADADYLHRLREYDTCIESPSSHGIEVKETISWRRDEFLYMLQTGSVVFRERKYTALKRLAHAAETIELVPWFNFLNSPVDIYQQAANCDASAEFDRFVCELGVKRLCEYTLQGKPVRLILRQSAAVFDEYDYIESIKDMLRRLQTVGSGLVLEFALPSIATRMDRSIDLFHELAALGICISLSHFPYNKSGYKALAYLRAEIVRPRSSSLFEANENMERITRKIHYHHTEIILPVIEHIEMISPKWWQCADYVQAEFPQYTGFQDEPREDLLSLYRGAYCGDHRAENARNTRAINHAGEGRRPGG